MTFYDEMDLMKIEDFLGRIQHYQSSNGKREHCTDCGWIASKIEAMYEKAKEYAKMRMADDDVVEWNTLILEVLDMQN
ncbi:Protein CBG12560 [Caenorhabditis briggsae]|uniref:Uncharacterized protein n=2 Tax=Caenorhabditis briggsae TaxID=6238 RepID=A0AAE9DX42_CAEBR|nr:Protein CBG12560 [Caenorhabditis briggsae]ULU12672.1 hypothetical protein L3Y34_015728 [Caenorhabditis briggsae]UMM13627.1 hypothetical protein L5515_001801 [Caenorhabditis briggsae]CAP31521.1 Protein CBG12560 [Caenorhabditis briggsae]